MNQIDRQLALCYRLFPYLQKTGRASTARVPKSRIPFFLFESLATEGGSNEPERLDRDMDCAGLLTQSKRSRFMVGKNRLLTELHAEPVSTSQARTPLPLKSASH